MFLWFLFHHAHVVVFFLGKRKINLNRQLSRCGGELAVGQNLQLPCAHTDQRPLVRINVACEQAPGLKKHSLDEHRKFGAKRRAVGFCTQAKALIGGLNYL